ncbi:hypothetical protein GPECTOR_107g156 [Gonium pectorale]|uniref:Uncharacterized protein n=1 Tax=Gonium pectorale TaxID=33097 RepID=A0A150FZH4_GONPE|nr:hypothetical protein GPECTOR_107g156 [Gonium pectorale]|eukprot:KXZ43011.1 hypothetical protein GPECTOR_107g156 [Gonium pectorale]
MRRDAQTTQSVEVAGRLVVAGSGGGEGGGEEAAEGGGAATTTLDLTAFQDGPAFLMLNGSSLELHNLTILLPPAPPDALTAQPPTVLSHVIGGSPARVTLSGVRLVLTTQTELAAYTRQLCDPQHWAFNVRRLEVLRGEVLFGNGSMPLGWAPPLESQQAAFAASASTTLMPSPAAALLLRTVVSCCGGDGSGPPGPWVCTATAVWGAAHLLATAREAMPATSGLVLLSLAAHVTLDPEAAGGPLEVRSGVKLCLYGNPDLGAAGPTTQLDFAGIESAVRTTAGFVQLQDLVLLGLPYPAKVGNLVQAVAAWVHAVEIVRRPAGVVGAPRPVVRLSVIRCALVLPAAEAAWWRAAIAAEAAAPGGAGPYLEESWWMAVEPAAGPAAAAGATTLEAGRRPVSLLDEEVKPSRSLTSCVMWSIEEAGVAASPRAAAVAAAWPLGSQYDQPSEAAQLKLRDFRILGHWTPEPDLVLECRSSPTGVTVLVPSEWQMFPVLDETERATGNGTLLITSPGLLRWELPDDSPCALMGWPASQTGRRTMWDMQGAVAQLGLPPSSPLTLVDVVLYNLAPAGTELQRLSPPPPSKEPEPPHASPQPATYGSPPDSTDSSSGGYGNRRSVIAFPEGGSDDGAADDPVQRAA